jgi:hypothetical protein
MKAHYISHLVDHGLIHKFKWDKVDAQTIKRFYTHLSLEIHPDKICDTPSKTDPEKDICYNGKTRAEVTDAQTVMSNMIDDLRDPDKAPQIVQSFKEIKHHIDNEIKDHDHFQELGFSSSDPHTQKILGDSILILGKAGIQFG